MLVFACLSPHPPIILPNVGSPTDQTRVKRTIESLQRLGRQLDEIKPDYLVISSPHPDWGFNVPLHFLARKIRDIEVKTYLTDFESPQVHYDRGKQIGQDLSRSASGKKGAWIASGDMSHRLREDGPYGLHPSGPKFDAKFMELLQRKNVVGILNLNPRLVEEAGECGLRSFCMLLGALAGTKVDWQPEILSYEAPFGVGYLVANIRIHLNKK